MRGYRKNQALTDNGAVASAEYRAPMRDLMMSRHTQPTGEPHWVGAVFIDGGYGWNSDLPNPQLRKLMSAGASISWRPNDRVTAEFYAASRLEKAPSQADDQLQDYGIGFRLTTRLW